MYFAQHTDSCGKKFGDSFAEVHLFLDQYADQFDGYDIRILLHHSLGVDLVVSNLGEEAAQPAMLHIREDT